MKRYDAIVVGAGHNGLTCAAYLARAGKQVLVLERRHLVGGATVTEELHPGFKFSACSYVVSLLRPWIMRDLELPRHGLEILPLESTFTPFPEAEREPAEPPVPVALARSLAPRHPVVAVVLSSPVKEGGELPQTSLLGPQPVLERMSRFRLAQAFNVFSRAMGISSRLLTELRLQIEKPEVLIRPAVDHIGLLDRVDVHELARLGEAAAHRVLPGALKRGGLGTIAAKVRKFFDRKL